MIFISLLFICSRVRGEENYFQYRVVSQNETERSWDQLKWRQIFKERVICVMEHLRPLPHKDRDSATALKLDFKFKHLKLISYYSSPNKNVLGLEYAVLKENFRSKILILSPTLIDLESKFIFRNYSSLSFSYKKESKEFSHWTLRPYAVGNYWEIRYQQTFAELLRCQMSYHHSSHPFLRTDLEREFLSTQTLKLSLNFNPSGDSKWTLYYQNTFHPALITVSLLDWFPKDNRREESLSLSQSLKICLTPLLSLSGGFKVIRKKPYDTHTQFIRLELKRNHSWEVIGEYGSSDEDSHREKIQLLTQYSWN